MAKELVYDENGRIIEGTYIRYYECEYNNRLTFSTLIKPPKCRYCYPKFKCGRK